MTGRVVYEARPEGSDDDRSAQRAAAIAFVQQIADTMSRIEQKCDQTLWLVNEMGRRLFGDKAAPAAQAARSVAGFGKQLAGALDVLFGRQGQ